MGIIDDVRPYMDVRRFSDATDVVRAYTEQVYDNIFPESPTGTRAPREYTTLYPEGGLYRRGTYAEAGRITHVDVFFEPVVGGNRWRGVVKRLNGDTLASSTWRAVTGRARHGFEMQVPYTVAANEEVLIGVEPEDLASTAKAFTSEVPNDLMPGSLQVDKGTYHFKVPPTTAWTGKILVAHGGSNGTVRRLDPETGSTILWETPSVASEIRAIQIAPDGNSFAYGWSGTVRLADPVDGSTIWDFTVTGKPIKMYFTSDSTKLYVITDGNNLYALDIAAATPPVLLWQNTDVGFYFALSPDESKIYARSRVNAARVVEVNTADGSMGWIYEGTTIYSITCSNEKVYVGYSGTIEQIDAASGIRDWSVSGTARVYDFGYRPGDDYLYYLNSSNSIRRLLLETQLDEMYIDVGSYTYDMIYDGTHFYVGHNQSTYVRQFNAVTGQLVWTSPTWPTTSTSTIYQAGMAVNNAQNWDNFDQLTALKLAMGTRREVDFDPLATRDGVLRAHHYFRTFVELPVRTLDLKGLTPTVGLLKGQGRQVKTQYSVDNGASWNDLDLDKRNSFTASVLQVRLAIEPADYIENWERSLTTSGTIADHGYVSDVSKQPYRDNDGPDGALSYSTPSDEYGSYWNLTNSLYEARDNYYFGVDPSALHDADGDLDFIVASLANVSYPHQLWFRGTWGAAWRLMIRYDGLWLYNPGGLEVAASGAWPAGAGAATSGHYHFRIIWKGDRFVAFRNGVKVLEYTGLTDGDPFLGWNEEIIYANLHVHAIRGRGMAGGNPIQTEVRAADLVELSHAALFFDRV